MPFCLVSCLDICGKKGEEREEEEEEEEAADEELCGLCSSVVYSCSLPSFVIWGRRKSSLFFVGFFFSAAGTDSATSASAASMFASAASVALASRSMTCYSKKFHWLCYLYKMAMEKQGDVLARMGCYFVSGVNWVK